MKTLLIEDSSDETLTDEPPRAQSMVIDEIGKRNSSAQGCEGTRSMLIAGRRYYLCLFNIFNVPPSLLRSKTCAQGSQLVICLQRNANEC